MPEATHTILCVDDEVGILKALNRLLRRGGYRVLTAENGEHGLEILKKEPVNLIISDQRMPRMSGTEFLRLSRKIRPDAIQIMLTAYADMNAATAAINQGGICKFILKPWNDAQLLEAIKGELKRYDLERKLEEYERNKEYAIIFGLAKLAESRDPETGEHLLRVEKYTRLLAEQLATIDKYAHALTPDWVQNLAQSSVLHDIGKVGIPDAILLKPGPLTTEEWPVMQTHAKIGGETLAASESVLNMGAETFLSLGREIAYHHHEWHNGEGYPFGLAGEAIPLAARIVTVADGYDALRSKRPYKEALPHETVKAIILEDRGRRYHPMWWKLSSIEKPTFSPFEKPRRSEDVKHSNVIISSKFWDGSFFGEVWLRRLAPQKKPMAVVFRVPWSVSLRNTQHATRHRKPLISS